MADAEMKGFIFSVTFMLLFATILAAWPIGLQGPGSSPENVVPVDPHLLTGFEESENYTRTAYSAVGALYLYEYSLGSYDWMSYYTDVTDLSFYLYAKVYTWIFWFGHTDACKFTSSGGIDRGTTLTIDEIEADAEDGAASYSLTFTTSGKDAGGFIFYWNETLYADPEDAWDNDVLNLLHGIGFGTTATNDVLGLILGLLFFSLPEVPVLVNALIAFPIWVCIAFLLWYFVTSLIPFVSP